MFITKEIMCCDLQKVSIPILSGVGFLDHMIDQMNSHAQVGIGLTILQEKEEKKENDNASFLIENKNRLSDSNQTELMKHIGTEIGKQLKSKILVSSLQSSNDNSNNKEVIMSRFCCPLDESLVECVLQFNNNKQDNDDEKLLSYKLAPYGVFPKSTGRNHIGQMETLPLEQFWNAVAVSSGLQISFTKIRGTNGHHIIESSFKAFSRALRNLIDGTDTTTTTSNDNRIQNIWTGKVDLAKRREGKVERKTKETSIKVHLIMDEETSDNDANSNDGPQKKKQKCENITIDTGIETLNDFFTQLVKASNFHTIIIQCNGDLYVDDHHTAEDVSIAFGQVLTQALGNKAGLNRMWCSTIEIPNNNDKYVVEVTMDLSNRPYFHHNLHNILYQHEYIGSTETKDFATEMFEHVLDSLVVNGRMTVHIVLRKNQKNATSIEDEKEEISIDKKDLLIAVATAFGECLKYCCMLDCRRAGQTASSKGTLSV